jgi:transposase
VRRAIYRRWRKHEAVTSIAQDLGLAERTVRCLVQRFAQRGEPGLLPDYTGCGTKSIPSSVHQQVLQMRLQHPTWGAGLIRVLLQRDCDACPSERTLQRWFRRAAAAPALPRRRPASADQRARRPHEVWQMDAADQMLLASGQGASWLRLVDECSGAVLQTTIFPPTVLEPGADQRRAKRVAVRFFPPGKAQTPARR